MVLLNMFWTQVIHPHTEWFGWDIHFWVYWANCSLAISYFYSNLFWIRVTLPMNTGIVCEPHGRKSIPSSPLTVFGWVSLEWLSTEIKYGHSHHSGRSVSWSISKINEQKSWQHIEMKLFAMLMHLSRMIYDLILGKLYQNSVNERTDVGTREEQRHVPPEILQQVIKCPFYFNGELIFLYKKIPLKRRTLKFKKLPTPPTDYN